MNQPKAVIIIGSVRSGTNMLRDILVRIPGYGTWDCDEINPIWRHGNLNHPDDELSKEMATPKIISFIRNEFKKIAKSLKINTVVEKSTANSLRLAYVNKIFPDAKYIFIYRDGRDVAASARLRWNAKFDFNYSFKKFRYVPVVDMPYILYYYLANRVKGLFSDEQKLKSWGPRYKNMDEDVKKYSILEVCALQWKHYVENTLADLPQVNSANLLTLQYETLVNNPEEEMIKVCKFLDLPSQTVQDANLTKGISNKSVGNWKKLDQQQIDLIEKHIDPLLSKLNYK